MTKFNATIASAAAAASAASAAAALLLAGNAFAQMPAAGEGPLFLDEAQPVAAQSLARAKVSIQQVASGEMTGVVEPANDLNQPTRAEVRQQTREAIAQGQIPAIGERS